MMETLHGLVAGHVQGVGFRWHVRKWARHFGVEGWVRNLPDGRVEFMAQGPRPQLEALLAKVREGPAGSQVSALDPRWIEHEALGPFSIR